MNQLTSLFFLALLHSSIAHYLPLRARQVREPACSTGSSYLACTDGYTGCFTEPPCPTRQCKPACPTDGKTATISQPVMYNLFPNQPDRAQTPVSYIEVSSRANLPVQVQNQAAVFKNIPQSAKTCTFRWAQAAAANRNFHVQGSGLVSITQLSGFPSNDSAISAASIAPFEEPATKFNIDFTSWDQTLTATTHIGSILNCSQTLYVKAAINPLNGAGDVHFEQDAHNGLYIEYSC